MKRILFLILVILWLAACDPEPRVRWREEWIVRNSSGQDLYIKPCSGYRGVIHTDSSFVIKDAVYYTDVEKGYLYCAKLWEWLELVEISVISIDDILLKKWTMEGEEVGRNFFDEKDWNQDYDWYVNAPQTRKWIFEILPEDIAVSD